ncbi:MAG: carboxypeptidase-like regulatory domain-containing protein, partial [Desulfobacterales bacterium]|nr:carboxypeptidase-like regulatory domain-containing protein [Desulfobacterales bacterium]
MSLSRTTRFTVTAINPGGQAAAEARVQVTGERPPQPEGSFGRKYEDLIPGDASIHRYAPGRFTLITGRVETISGAPLPDASVTVHDHLEYGTAYTDAQGAYTLPVQGGDVITLVFEKSDLLTAHRKVRTPWNDVVVAETVRMIGEDPASTTFIFDGDPNTVISHQSTPVTDEF